MKLLDSVRVINNNYQKDGIVRGMIGTIIDADIRWDSFYVCFQDQRIFDKQFMSLEENILKLKDDICIGIKIKDLELIENGNASDKLIKNSLPEGHKNWWCKVENGFIINLNGEKKNKIPFDYDS